MATWEDGVIEGFNLSRNPSGRIDGYVIDAIDKFDAIQTSLANTPNVYGNILRQRVEANLITTGEWQGDWYVDVHYGLVELPEEGVVRFTASSKGGREKITQAISIFDSVGIDSSNPAPDTGLAIGVDADGNVNGVEVPVPNPFFSLEVHTDYAVLDDAYWAFLDEATGKVNDDTFFGRPSHTVRFEGYDHDGQIRLDNLAEQVGRLRLDFRYSREYIYDPTVAGSGIDIPGLQRPVSKRGFDYLDIGYSESKDPASNTIVRRPSSVKVSQVSHELDFGLFGIGT